MSTQRDIIQRTGGVDGADDIHNSSQGSQINQTIAKVFLPRLKNKLVALACTNNMFRTSYRDELTKDQSPKRGDNIDIRLPHFLNAIDNHWNLGTDGYTDQSGDRVASSPKNINSYPDWLLNVKLDQHLVLPLQHSTTMKMFLINLDEWVEPATDKLANRIDNRFMEMIHTKAGGSGAQVTNKNGKFTFQALEFVRGRIEANGEIGDNLCAVMPTKLRHLITGDFTRGVQQYPSSDVKSLTMKGVIGNMGGINMYVSTYVPTHTCGDYGGTLLIDGSAGKTNGLTVKADGSIEGAGSGINEGYRVQSMKVTVKGFDARSATQNTPGHADDKGPVFKAGDEFVVGTSLSDFVGEVNLYNGQPTGNWQVLTVVKDVYPGTEGEATQAGNAGNFAEVEVSPGLFDKSNSATGAYKGITRNPKNNDKVYCNGRPNTTYDQVLIWNKQMAAFLPVMIPELPNVINKTVRDKNSGLTFNVATDSDIDNRTTLTRWDSFWGMNYFTYGNNDACRLRVQAIDFSKDGDRGSKTATAATDLVDDADSTYTNVHGPFNGGLMPTCVVPVQPDTLTRAV